MPEVLFKLDLNKPMDEQEIPGHNRWHPDIPAAVSVNPSLADRALGLFNRFCSPQDNNEPYLIEIPSNSFAVLSLSTPEYQQK